MPRKRNNRQSPIERRSDGEEDDFFFDDNQSNSGRSPQEPVHRNAANARERARMRVLSKAFCRLKTTLPWVPADTKLSKLDTLRLAASYIAHLRALLQDEPRTAAQMFPHPLNLAWPFAFQHGSAVNCATSPKWFTNPDSSPHNHVTNPSKLNDSRENNNCGSSSNECNHDYVDNEYSEREYEVGRSHSLNNVQYYNNCNQFKDSYYSRNSYSSDNLMNV